MSLSDEFKADPEKYFRELIEFFGNDPDDPIVKELDIEDLAALEALRNEIQNDSKQQPTLA